MINQEPEEIWKPIDGYEGIYEVSNLGRVKSLKKIVLFRFPDKKRFIPDRIFKKSVNVYGYIIVSLHLNLKIKQFRVHRLVARAFIPNPENKPYVNHIDGNKQNNRVDNLEWCTAQENSIHAVKSGLLRNSSLRGDLHNSLKLKFKQVEEIRELRNTGMGLKFIASMYGISKDYTSKLVNYKHRVNE